VKRLCEYEQMEVDSKAALIQELIPLGLMHIEEMLQAEVFRLAGEKYKRNGQPEYKRWGSQRGSVYIKDQKIPIKVQRVRDVRNSKEISLNTYERFQKPRRVVAKGITRVKHEELSGVFRSDTGGILVEFLYGIQKIHKSQQPQVEGAHGAKAGEV